MEESDPESQTTEQTKEINERMKQPFFIETSENEGLNKKFVPR